MKRLTPVTFRPMRASRASEVARFVAPIRPLDRVGSALALTAALAIVQLGLLAGHAGLNVCRLAGGVCGQVVAGGRVLEGPSAVPGQPRRARATHANTSTPSNLAQAQGPVQTVSFRLGQTAQPGRGGSRTAKATGSTARGGAAVRQARRLTRAHERLRVARTLLAVATQKPVRAVEPRSPRTPRSHRHRVVGR